MKLYVMNLYYTIIYRVWISFTSYSFMVRIT